MLLVRGVNILRNRKEQISQGVTSTESHSSQVESRLGETDQVIGEKDESPEAAKAAPAKKPNLAARRGKSLLAINLGAGTYFVPTSGSATTTPIQEVPSRRGSAQIGPGGILGGPSTQHLLGYSDSPLSASSSAQAPSSVPVTPFSPFGPSSPTSERLAELSQGIRRKSSVTFADGISPMASTPLRSPPMHTPTLEVIVSSPPLGSLSIHDALASNRSETARTLETEEGKEIVNH